MKQSISHPSALYTFIAIGKKGALLETFYICVLLTMALSFAIAPIGRLMTIEVTISHVGLIIITLAMKT